MQLVNLSVQIPLPSTNSLLTPPQKEHQHTWLYIPLHQHTPNCHIGLQKTRDLTGLRCTATKRACMLGCSSRCTTQPSTGPLYIWPPNRPYALKCQTGLDIPVLGHQWVYTHLVTKWFNTHTHLPLGLHTLSCQMGPHIFGHCWACIHSATIGSAHTQLPNGLAWS